MAPPSHKWYLLKETDRLRLNEFDEIFLKATSRDDGRVAFIYFDQVQEVTIHINALLQKKGFANTEFVVICPEKHLSEIKKLLDQEKIESKLRTFTSGQTINLAMDGENQKIRAQGLVTPNSSSTSNIRVMIVDDSSTVRKILRKAMSRMDGVDVVAETGNPLEAESLIESSRANVMTLDMQMPEMSGPELLKSLKPTNRIPAVVVTSLAMDEGNAVIDALENGAVDYLKKPSLKEIGKITSSLYEKLKIASSQANKSTEKSKPLAVSSFAGSLDTSQFLAIGCSTGGPDALSQFLPRLPKNIPPTLIVQHIPKFFSKALAERLNKNCKFEVREASNGDELKPGLALVAPGERQLKVIEDNGRWLVNINDDPPMEGHKPSVDYMMKSVAKIIKSRALGIILTGMGGDGAKGLLAMREAGARTMTQSEETCVVYGMPRQADLLGASEESVDLDKMALRTCERLAKPSQNKINAA